MVVMPGRPAPGAVRARDADLAVASADAAASPADGDRGRPAAAPPAVECARAATEADADRRQASAANGDRRVAVAQRHRVALTCPAARRLAALVLHPSQDALQTAPPAARSSARASAPFAAQPSWAVAASVSSGAVPRCEDAASGARRGQAWAFLRAARPASEVRRVDQVAPRRRPRPVLRRPAPRPELPRPRERLQARRVPWLRSEPAARRPVRRLLPRLPPGAARPASPF
jgi:hypothetical protein